MNHTELKNKILDHIKNICALKHSDDIYGIFDLPVHLEHLLFALDKVSNGDWFATIASNGWFHIRTDRVFYDLTKSVEQNLEDQQVCEVISKLLKLK